MTKLETDIILNNILIIFLCRDTVKTASYIAKREGEADCDTTSILVPDDIISLFFSPYSLRFRFRPFIRTLDQICTCPAKKIENGRDSNPGRLDAV